MSVHVSSWVLRYSNARGSDRMALLVFADHADHSGGNTYPSAGTIAFEGRMGLSTAREARNRLAEQGRLIPDGFDPWGKGIPRFRVRMDVEAEGPPPARHKGGGPDSDPGGYGEGPPGGLDSGAGGSGDQTLTVQEPSDEPSTSSDDPDVEAAVDAVGAYWKASLGKAGERLKLTPARRKKVRTRLTSDGVPLKQRVDDLKTAIDGCMGSEWHRTNGHFDLELILRSPEKVDQFIARAKAKTDRSAGDGNLDQYDQAIIT